MSNIKLLDKNIWSKIAAGEVIERPASVVKELVENSIDAGANFINVILSDGGKLNIIVEDNGEGINFDELPLALTYHATSKIQNLNDLENILTLGYRGEALASLVAVADVNITSKTEFSECGGIIKTSDGKIIQHEKINCKKGTRVHINNLFGSLPARKKFLKSAISELRRCATYLREYAVCNPNIIFSLENDNKLIFKTEGDGNILNVLNKIWGEGAEIQNVSSYFQHLNLNCWFQAKFSRSDFMIFVNGRAVNDQNIKSAILSASGNLNGNWALFFTIDPALVDVNIHPAKSEVRFRYPDEIFKVVKNIINSLGSPQPVINFNNLNLKNVPAMSNEKNFIDIKPEPVHKNNFEPKTEFNFKPAEKPKINLNNDNDNNQNNEPQITLSDFMQNNNDQQNIIFLGQLSTGYLVFDNYDGLILMDPHAAHERINYEKFKNAAKSSNSSQKLLIPIILHPTLAIEAQEFFSEINNSGFELKNTPSGIAINAVPSATAEISEPEILLRISLNALKNNHDGDIKNLLWRTWATYACKASIKLNTKISAEGALLLWKNLFKCEQPYICPHGRPTVLKISRQDLAKHFGRE